MTWQWACHLRLSPHHRGATVRCEAHRLFARVVPAKPTGPASGRPDDRLRASRDPYAVHNRSGDGAVATTKFGDYGSLLWHCFRRDDEELPRPRQRAVDHRHRIRQTVDRDERTEARAFFLTQQHLIEHVEPVERDPRPAVLALLHWVQERLAPAALVDHVLDLLGGRAPRQVRQRRA